jgi:hypothetical protein
LGLEHDYRTAKKFFPLNIAVNALSSTQHPPVLTGPQDFTSVCGASRGARMPFLGLLLPGKRELALAVQTHQSIEVLQLLQREVREAVPAGLEGTNS